MSASADADERDSSLLETALRNDRLSTILLLVLVPLVCWMWMIVMSRDMYGTMTGASRWMMTPYWDVSHLLLLWAMWAVMMAGMMLPSAAPVLLLYGAAARRSRQPAGLQIYAAAAGYLTIWTMFSLGATGLQRLLGALLVFSPMMQLTSPAMSAALLAVAGVYQFTPAKYACLRACQSPLGVILSKWRSGMSGAFRMGLEHGAYCVGCCWPLMLLLFVGGVMNLMVIAALTAFVAFEKLTPLGVRGARLSGTALIAAAVWLLVR